jgi:flagellar FliL protein
MVAITTGDNVLREPNKSPPNIVVTLALMTLIGVGLGAGFGFFLVAPQQAAKDVPPAEVSAAAVEQRFRFPADAIEVVLAPIIATIGHDSRHRMRIECSVVMTKEAASAAILKTELAEDIIAFLRGVSIEDVSGAHGFQNLREDLDEVARIRGHGAILGLLISGFVVE